jgi:hypothetical protein
MREFVAEVARAQAKVRERREMRGQKEFKGWPWSKGERDQRGLVLGAFLRSSAAKFAWRNDNLRGSSVPRIFL